MHKPQRPKSAKGRTRPSRYQRLLTSPAGTERNKGNTKFHLPISKIQQNIVKNPVESLVKGDHNKSSTVNLPAIKRPLSSLLKYKRVLPKINCSSGDKELNFCGSNEVNKCNQIEPAQQTTNSAEEHRKVAMQQHDDVKKVAERLADVQITEIQIALRLPINGGERLSLTFHSDNTLRDVLEYAARKCNVPVDFIEQDRLQLCNQQHTVIQGIDSTLSQLGVDKELFHVVID